MVKTESNVYIFSCSFARTVSIHSSYLESSFSNIISKCAWVSTYPYLCGGEGDVDGVSVAVVAALGEILDVIEEDDDDDDDDDDAKRLRPTRSCQEEIESLRLLFVRAR